MYRVGQEIQITDLVLLGDFADFYSISFYPKQANRNELLKDDVDVVSREFRRMEKIFPRATKTFLEGNHEYRLQRYINEKARELFGLVTINSLFNLGKEWKVVPYGESLRIGKLLFVHRGASGKGAALKAIDAYEHNVVMGDLHRLELSIKANYTGEMHMGAICGWLGDISKAGEYLKQGGKNFANWCLGFATAVVMDDGNFFLDLHPIVEYKCFVNGRMFKG